MSHGIISKYSIFDSNTYVPASITNGYGYGSTQASTRFSPLTAPIANGARLTKTKTVLYTAVAYKNWALYSFHYQ